MQLSTIHGTIKLTPSASSALSSAASSDDEMMDLLAQLGVTGLKFLDGDTVPTERAYFDSEGYGPYDKADL